MSSTPQNIPGFIEGQYAEIPPDSYPQAISQGFKPGVTLTSPEGRKAVVPGDQAGKAVKENGFALGPPEQQPKTKMFSPAGDYAEVPNNAVQFGLKNGWKQAVDTTSPLGHSVPLPPDLAETAKKAGWGQGAPDTQPKPGFFASAVGSMMGINRDDIAKSRFDNSPLGQRAQAIQAQRLALNPRDTTDPRQDRLQAAKDLGIDPAHLQKLDELEAKAEKGVPWEDQLAEKFPVIGSQVRAAVKAVKPTPKGQQPVSGVERAGHGLAAALPFVGPMAEGSGEAFGQGEVKSGLGQAAFAALPFLTHAAPEVAPRSEPTVTPTLTLGERAKAAGVKLLSGGNTGQEKPLEPAAGPGTHAEVADYAANKGIDLTPAQATQSKPLKAIQAVGERAVVGGKPLQDVLTRQHGQVANAVSELQDRVGNPYTPDAEAVGEHLQSQANEKLQALKDKAQADYQDFKEKTGGQGFDVDLSPVVDKYKTELQKQGEVLKNVPEQFAAPIRTMLEKLSNIKSDLPKPEANPVVRMDTAQQLRSYYLEIARDKSGNIPSRVNRLAAQAAQDIDEAMEKSAGQNPYAIKLQAKGFPAAGEFTDEGLRTHADIPPNVSLKDLEAKGYIKQQPSGLWALTDEKPTADTWRRANQTWRQLQETYNDKASPLTKLISEPDTQKITASLLAKGRFGGNSKTIRTLSQNGYDLSPLRHQVISDIASQNFKLTNGGNGLGGYQLPFLKELFEPQDLTELLHLGRVARATKFELNPSGTSNVLEALQQMSSVAKSKSPSLLGAGAGFALGGPVGAAIGAGGAEGLVPAAAARFSANPRNLQRALGRPVLEGRELERGSATPEDINKLITGRPGSLTAFRFAQKEKAPGIYWGTEPNIDYQDTHGSPTLYKGDFKFKNPLVLNNEIDGVRELYPDDSPDKNWLLNRYENRGYVEDVTEVQRQLQKLAKKQGYDAIIYKEPETSEVGAEVHLLDKSIVNRQELGPTQAKSLTNFQRGSATPEDLDEALRAQFQKTSARDTDFSTQAKQELYPGRTDLTPPELSNVLRRAQELKVSTQAPAAKPVRGLGHYSPEDQAQVQALPEFLRQVEPRQLAPEEEKLAYGQARVSQLKQQLREATDPVEKEALQRQLDFVQNQRGSASPEEVEGLPMLVAQGKARVTAEPLTNHVDQLNDWVDQFMAKGRLRDPESRAGAGVAMGLRDSRPDQLLVAHGPDDQPVGYAGLSKPEGNYLNLEHLVVRPDLLADDAKLKGVGTQLMRSAASQAASQGKGLSLYPSKTAEGFYQRLGLTRLKGERTMVLSPENTQKLASQRGSGSMDDINRQLETAPVFYSKLEQLAQEKLPARFTGDQALATLRNAGVKADELAIADSFLRGQQSVSKSALMQYLRPTRTLGAELDLSRPGEPIYKVFDQDGNLVDHLAANSPRQAIQAAEERHPLPRGASLARSVQDVWKRGEDDASPPDAWVDNVGDLHQFISDYRDQQYNEDEAITKLVSEGWANDTAEAKELLADNASQLEDYARDEDVEIEHERQHSLGGPRYADHQLPGGENYRELLLQLPYRSVDLPSMENLLNGFSRARYGRPFDELSESQQLSAREELRDQNKDHSANFQSSHWDEPNVLGHLRMNDRTDVNGKKTLFLEELQSDWHQQGRRNGYREPTSNLNFNAEANKSWADLSMPVKSKWAKGNGVDSIEAENLWNRTAKSTRANTLENIYHSDDAGEVPDAPFKKDWHELLLKRALREAAEGGYDQLAWTPGDVQNERYGLSKPVDAVGYRKNNDGSFDISVRPKGLTIPKHIERNLDPSKLEGIVGKDVAQKILNGEGTKAKNFDDTWLEDPDLKIGGAGMRGFYDRLVPDFLNRYGKRWGAKVGSTEIETGEGPFKYEGPELSLYDINRLKGKYEGSKKYSPDEAQHDFYERLYDYVERGRTTSEAFARALGKTSWTQAERAASEVGGKLVKQPDLKKVPVIQITPKMRQDIMKGQPISDLMPKNQPRLPMQNVVSPRSEAQLPWA